MELVKSASFVANFLPEAEFMASCAILFNVDARNSLNRVLSESETFSLLSRLNAGTMLFK